MRAIPTVALLLLLLAPGAAASGPTAPGHADAAARSAVAGLAAATAVNDRDGNGLFDDLDAAFAAADTGDRLPVIVSFTDRTGTAAGVARLRAAAPRATVGRRFSIIPAATVALSAAEARRVAALPGVRQLELDRPGRRELDTATLVMGADAVVDELGITGSLDGDEATTTTGDIGIAVLDTGFHTAHQELDGKLVAWKDLGTGRDEPYDPDGHGTHVASIALGRGADPDMRGVAPGASLIGVKIDGGGSTSSNAIAAYEWLVQQRAALNIRVATMSFGFGTATDGTTALERAVDAAWNAGIVCLKSNGNGGPGLRTMTVPAAARGILAIGSLLDPAGVAGTYGFFVSHFSSRGPTTDGRVKPDLMAPGESIVAAQSGTEAGYVSKSGTSMASPFAAGTAALVLAADPSLTPDEVRSILADTAADRGRPGPDPDFGHGRIQVWHAVAEALRRRGLGTGASAPPAVPDQLTLGGTPQTGVLETSFTVRDTGFPVAVTALAGGQVAAVGAVLVRDPAGVPVGGVAVNTGPDRQHQVSFRPTSTGRYTVQTLAPPGAEIVLDVSHSTAP